MSDAPPQPVDIRDHAVDPDELVGGGATGGPRRVLIVLALVALLGVAGGIYLTRSGADGGAPGSASVVDGGNLGRQNDAQALSERLGPELAEREAAGGPVDPDSVPCGDSESALPLDQAQLLYSARLEWEGTPAVVLGYRVEGPALSRLLVVMAEADCRLIVTQSF